MQNSYSRGLPRKPSKKPCENGLFDDGKKCLERKACRRVPCFKDKNGCLECGTSIVKMDESERLYCNPNEDKIGNLCYKKCKEGYYNKGSSCVKGISNEIKSKIKIPIEQKGMLPNLVTLIKETALRVLGKKKQNSLENKKKVSFENKKKEGFEYKEYTKEQRFLTWFDNNILKKIVGKNLEKYRWYIFGILIIIFLLLPTVYNVNPKTPQAVKIKYNNYDDILFEKFLRDL